MNTIISMIERGFGAAESIYKKISATKTYQIAQDTLLQMLRTIENLTLVKKLKIYSRFGLQQTMQKTQSVSSIAFTAMDLGFLFVASGARIFYGNIILPNSASIKDMDSKKRDLTVRPSRITKDDAFINLYQYEGCPFCKKVREALCALGLSYNCYPCPRETLKNSGVSVQSRFRPSVKRIGGKLLFPFLEDTRTGVKMYESDDIIMYLFETYGAEHASKLETSSDLLPVPYKLVQGSFLDGYSLSLSSVLRPMMDMGVLRIESKPADKALHLYGYEASLLCKKVRERLDSLELQYSMHVTSYTSVIETVKPFAVFNDEKLSTPQRNAYAKLFRCYIDQNGMINASFDDKGLIVNGLNGVFKKNISPKRTLSKDYDQNDEESNSIMQVFQEIVKSPMETCSKYSGTVGTVLLSQFLEIPILIDPNEFEKYKTSSETKNVYLGHNEIIAHIDQYYQKGEAPNETWLDYPMKS